MNVRQKEIVLIPYPFTNLAERKVRPALIVSNDVFNKQDSDCVAVPLTSVMKDTPYAMSVAQTDMKSGKLLKQSKIRLDKVFSVEQRLIVMKIGIVSNGFFERVKKELIDVF